MLLVHNTLSTYQFKNVLCLLIKKYLETLCVRAVLNRFSIIINSINLQTYEVTYFSTLQPYLSPYPYFDRSSEKSFDRVGARLNH